MWTFCTLYELRAQQCRGRQIYRHSGEPRFAPTVVTPLGIENVPRNNALAYLEEVEVEPCLHFACLVLAPMALCSVKPLSLKVVDRYVMITITYWHVPLNWKVRSFGRPNP